MIFLIIVVKCTSSGKIIENLSLKLENDPMKTEVKLKPISKVLFQRKNVSILIFHMQFLKFRVLKLVLYCYLSIPVL